MGGGQKPVNQLAQIGGRLFFFQRAGGGGQGVGIIHRVLAGGFQLGQHGADDIAHAAAQRFHGARGAGAGLAAQADFRQRAFGKGCAGGDHLAHDLGHGRVRARGIGIEKFEIFRRGHDGAFAHQGNCGLGEILFAVRPVHHRPPAFPK